MAATSGPRTVRAPRGRELTCRGWAQEAALRMLMNNLDPEVAEDPDHLVVYGGTVGAAGPHRELQPGRQVGDLGCLPRARAGRADDVRPDDGRLVDLHRHAGHP